jgi:uncharacterized DUF497 family protein
MPFNFEWDKSKAQENVRKHGVAFAEATTVFADPLAMTKPDAAHSTHEPREVTMGISYRRRLLVVVHTERGDNTRIISARLATRHERKMYEEN